MNFVHFVPQDIQLQKLGAQLFLNHSILLSYLEGNQQVQVRVHAGLHQNYLARQYQLNPNSYK